MKVNHTMNWTSKPWVEALLRKSTYPLARLFALCLIECKNEKEIA